MTPSDICLLCSGRDVRQMPLMGLWDWMECEDPKCLNPFEQYCSSPYCVKNYSMDNTINSTWAISAVALYSFIVLSDLYWLQLISLSLYWLSLFWNLSWPHCQIYLLHMPALLPLLTSFSLEPYSVSSSAIMWLAKLFVWFVLARTSRSFILNPSTAVL